MKWSLVIPAMALVLASSPCRSAQPWRRHTIDDSSRGADGVRLADANGDGRLDLVTGWEEGGRVRLYLQPEPDRTAEAWPVVTVGSVRSPEDAVLADLDGDGALDVVSCCEGRERTVFVHWAPRDPARLLDPQAWETEPIPATRGRAQWMFCLPLDVDGRGGTDLVVGAKEKDAHIGWLESPDDPRDLAAWRWHPLREAGWIMSLVTADMDADGDGDVLLSDRKGPRRGIWWLEHPGPDGDPTRAWREHAIGGLGREVMFLTLADLDGDDPSDVVAAVKGGGLLWCRPPQGSPHGEPWGEQAIPVPDWAGGGKAVAVGDLDLDGAAEIVVTCEGAVDRSGVFQLARRPTEPSDWVPADISGASEGIKYDRVELLDLDADGDLDVITCEERDGLGVVWYENLCR